MHQKRSTSYKCVNPKHDHRSSNIVKNSRQYPVERSNSSLSQQVQSKEKEGGTGRNNWGSTLDQHGKIEKIIATDKLIAESKAFMANLAESQAIGNRPKKGRGVLLSSNYSAFDKTTSGPTDDLGSFEELHSSQVTYLSKIQNEIRGLDTEIMALQ